MAEGGAGLLAQPPLQPPELHVAMAPQRQPCFRRKPMLPSPAADETQASMRPTCISTSPSAPSYTELTVSVISGRDGRTLVAMPSITWPATKAGLATRLAFWMSHFWASGTCAGCKPRGAAWADAVQSRIIQPLLSAAPLVIQDQKQQGPRQMALALVLWGHNHPERGAEIGPARLAGRDVHRQVDAGHHDAVARRQDLVQRRNGVRAVDLGDDLHPGGAGVIQHRPHLRV